MAAGRQQHGHHSARPERSERLADGSSSAISRIAGLDELRGIAILLVLLGHFLAARAPLLTMWALSPVVVHDDPASPPVPPAFDSHLAINLDVFRKAGTFSDVIEVRGWAVDLVTADGPGIERIGFYVDGELQGPAVYGLSRPDVAKHFGDDRFTLSGWMYPWNVSAVEPGRYVVTVEARAHNGATANLERTITLHPAPHWPWDAPWVLVIGQVGVDLFFVISGFLITTILLRTKRQPRFLRNFYVRRALRILPLAFAVIVVAYLLYPESRSLIPFYLAFMANYLPYATGQAIHVLAPMWSLAVEEHFYLVFPLVCLVSPRRWLWVAVGALFLGGFTAHGLSGNQIDWIYTGEGRTHARGHLIALGAWLALLGLQLVPRPWACAGAFAAYALVFLGTGGGSVGILELPIGVLLAGAVYLAVSRRFALSIPALRFLGVRCYSLYLLHLFVLVLHDSWPRLPLPIELLLFLGITVLLAHLSYQYFERPIIALGPKYRPSPPDLERRADRPNELVDDPLDLAPPRRAAAGGA